MLAPQNIALIEATLVSQCTGSTLSFFSAISRSMIGARMLLKSAVSLTLMPGKRRSNSRNGEFPSGD
jgi:hypothetical protein